MRGSIILLLLLMTMFGRLLEGKWYNLLSLFCGMWSLILFLTRLGLYGLVEVSSNAYLIVLLGNIGFFLGYVVLCATYQKNQLFRKNVAVSQLKVKEAEMPRFAGKVMWVLSVIALLYYAYRTVDALQLLMSGYDYVYVRDVQQGYAETQTQRSGFLVLLEIYVTAPSIYMLIPSALISLFSNKKDVPYIVVTLIAVGLFIFSTAGRITLVYIIIDMLFLANLYGVSLSKKTKMWIRRSLVTVLVLGIVLTFFRSRAENSEGVFKSLYAYLVLCMPLLDYHVDNVADSGIYTYGVAFLLGIFRIIFLLGKQMGFTGFDLYQTTVQRMALTESTWVYAFHDAKHNAFVTMFFYFYSDFGYLGVLVGSLLFGVFCCWVYRKLLNKFDWAALYFFVILLQVVIKSLVRWEFAFLPYAVALFYSLLIYWMSTKVKIRGVKRLKFRIGMRSSRSV